MARKASKKQKLLEYEQRAFDLTDLQREPPHRATIEELYRLHQALEPFVDLELLRTYAAEQQNLYKALRSDRPPAEVRAIIDTVAAVLAPVGREQVKSPRDVAALLMVEMGALDQEE